MNVLLHLTTKKQVEVIRIRPKNAYVFHGRPGLGKFTSALQLASEWAGVEFVNYTSASDIVIVQPEKQSIGIAQMAEVIHGLQLSRSSERRRTVIIDNAELLTTEAQNSLLKILEDSPAQTTVIFVASKLESLLATIRSRSIPIYFAPPNPDELKAYLVAKFPASHSAIVQLFSHGNPSPGLAHALLSDETLLEAALRGQHQAKNFLEASLFDRLVLTTELSKDTAKAMQLVELLASEASQELRQASDNSQILERMAALLIALDRFRTIQASNVGLKASLDTIAMAV